MVYDTLNSWKYSFVENICKNNDNDEFSPQLYVDLIHTKN